MNTARRRARVSPIMVAVKSLNRADSGNLLSKAARLAKERRCGLHLVHALTFPRPDAVSLHANVKQAALEIAGHAGKQLLQLAAGPRFRGLQIHTTIFWDYPAADGLVRQVLRNRPRLLLIESQRRARLARPFLTNTDWELIRQCPCPLWLSKPANTRITGTIAAAIDPLHARAKPAGLDKRIIERALEVAGRPGRVLACHAYTLPTRPPFLDGAFDARMVGRELELHEARVRDAVNRLADRFGIPAKNRLIVEGDPEAILPRVVRKYGASLIVMGAVSRGAIRRMFIGNTAERVIDLLDCDVLVVKPQGFKSRVAPRGSVVGPWAGPGGNE